MAIRLVTKEVVKDLAERMVAEQKLVIEAGPIETAAQAMGDAPPPKKKIKVEFYAKTRYVGSTATHVEELDADTSDEEIDAMAQDICAELYETGWVKRGFVK